MTERARVGPLRAASFIPPATVLQFKHADSGEPVPAALGDSVVLASSSGLGWNGLVAELGRSNCWRAENLAFSGHFLAMNMSEQPLKLERKGPHGHRRVTMPPGSLWLAGADVPFSHQNAGVSVWGCLEVTQDKVRRVLGCDLDTHDGYAVLDEPLSAVAHALFEETRTGGGSGPLFVDGLTVALVGRMARLFGVADKDREQRGTLPAEHMRRVVERVEDAIADPLTVDDLAAIAGLSPAHFAREFKRITHESPHSFVMRRRLERAWQHLATGGAIAEAASMCGFSDQAHLSRLFKRRFGATPGAFVRTVRGGRGIG